MKTILRNGICLDLPVGWNYVERKNSLGLYRECDGRGAMNISTMVTNRRIGPEELLATFSHGMATADRSWVGPDNASSVFGECNREGRIWRYWVIEYPDRAVFVSYNSAIIDIDENETDEVAKIV